MIKVDCIQASRCANSGQGIPTLICEYPLTVHAQLLTHKVLSKNSSSARAIPITKAIKQLMENPADPIFTMNQRGMQGSLATPQTAHDARVIHDEAMLSAISTAERMASIGIHKQNAGRYLTPFQNIKIVLTSTEWENWDWLRMDKDAQPEIKELAEKIYKARREADYMILQPGEWHVPFVARERDELGVLRYYCITDEDASERIELTAKDALKVSTSACAQTSYRNTDTSLEKARDIESKLFSGTKVHSSPAEHQAQALPSSLHKVDTSMSIGHLMGSLPDGISRMDRDFKFWSGNLKNFIQYRQLIHGHDRALSVEDKG